MYAEVLCRAVRHRTLVLAGLGVVDCVTLPSLSDAWMTIRYR